MYPAQKQVMPKLTTAIKSTILIALGREELLKRVWGEDYLGECDTFAGGKKSAHSVGLLNNNQSVNW